MKISKGKALILLGLVLVVIDQVIKIAVKTNMSLGESIPVLGEFFKISFVENEGMAFGMAWGGAAGKIVLSSLRIVLFGALCWWVNKLMKAGNGKEEGTVEKTPTGVLVGLAVIAAGALGNIIDCWFYGLVFSESTFGTVAQFGGHYAPFMLGKVVDMFSFSIFPPVFNFADSCVTCGAFYLAIFHWKFFAKN